MRIGIVCHPTFGGSGVLATELAAFLARQGQLTLCIHSNALRSVLHLNFLVIQAHDGELVGA